MVIMNYCNNNYMDLYCGIDKTFIIYGSYDLCCTPVCSITQHYAIEYKHLQMFQIIKTGTLDSNDCVRKSVF